MSYITATTLTNQTAVIIPRHTGQTIRLGSQTIHTVAEQPARVYGTGQLELSTGWWDMLTIVDGEYDGAPFDGSTPSVDIDGTPRKPIWDGPEDASTTTTQAFPTTIDVTVERDNGTGWEPIGVFTDDSTWMDWESLSYGDILYRAIAATIEGATTATEIMIPARSDALWLSGGVGFSTTCRLPLDPDITITPGRARTPKRYAGRSHPVYRVGEALERTVAFGGEIGDRDGDTATAEQLTDLAQLPTAVFLYRDPDKHLIYGSIGSIPLTRVGSDWDDDGEPYSVWGYSAMLTETKREG